MALRDILVTFGVVVDQTQLIEADKRVTSLIDKFETLYNVAKASALVLAGKALVGFISDTIEAANQVSILAARYGTTIEQTQELQAVTEASGVHFTQLLHGFRAINTAAEKGAAEFHELGINTRKANGEFKSQVDLFWETGEALAGVTNDTHRTYLAQRLLGRAGQQLLPIFRGNKEEIEAFRQKIRETSTVFSEAFVQKARMAALNMQVLHRTWEKAAGLLTEQLLPAFNYIVDKLIALGKWTQEWIKDGSAMNSIIAALVVGVGLISVAFGTWALEVAMVVAPIAFLFGLVEDFVTFLRGGRSTTGRLFETLLGPGGAKEAREGIQGVWEVVKQLFSSDPSKGDKWENFYKASAPWIFKVGALIEDVLRRAVASVSDALAQDPVLGPLLKAFSSVVGKPGDAKVNEKAVGAQPVVAGGPNDIEQTKKDHPILAALGGMLFSDAEQAAIQQRALDRAINSYGVMSENQKAMEQVPTFPTGMGPTPSLPGVSGVRISPIDGPRVAPVINNNITVEGSATAATAREIAAQSGKATAASLGRDRSAIGAGVGVR